MVELHLFFVAGELISQNVHLCSASSLKFSEAHVMSRCAQNENCSVVMFMSSSDRNLFGLCRSQSVTKCICIAPLTKLGPDFQRFLSFS